jgi:hypothetical protein
MDEVTPTTKPEKSIRSQEEIVKELELCSASIGQKHHQIECLKHQRQQYTIKMNELLLELKDAGGAEALSVV